MNLNEYLFKTSQSLMKRVLMYIDVDNNPNLLSIKNNNDISLDVNNYEWALISTLFLISDKYRNGTKLEDFLTDEDIEEIENILSESNEILPYDDPAQTQNCILDNENNTIATFNYLINGNVDDFYLSELDGYGTFYEEDNYLDEQLQEVGKENHTLKELKSMRDIIIEQQSKANKANELIISNGKLNTRIFVEWLRNALAHSHYVPYNDRQLRFFIKGKEKDDKYRFNAIIDKKIVSKIIDMVYIKAYANLSNSDAGIFEEFSKEIKEDINDTIYWMDENEKLLSYFNEYYKQIENCKNIHEIRKLLASFVNEIPKNDYFYNSSEVKDIINQLMTKNGITFNEIYNEVLDYLGEKIDIIKENDVINENSKFGWLYEDNNYKSFEEEMFDYLRTDLELEFLNEKMWKKILEIAKKDSDYNKKEICNRNKIQIILNITKKMLEMTNSIKILLKINDVNTKLRNKKIDWENYKLLVMSLLKCNFSDGYNINKDDNFEELDFSSFKIDPDTKKEYEAAMKNSNNKKIKLQYEESKKIAQQLQHLQASIKNKEEELKSKKIDNDYFLVKLPQKIEKLKLEYAKTLLQYQSINQNATNIDKLNEEIYNRKNINPFIMRHLRNAIAHGNINILSQGSTNISNAIIVFQDIDKENNNKLTFEGKIALIDILQIIASDGFQKTVFNAQENISKKAK